MSLDGTERTLILPLVRAKLRAVSDEDSAYSPLSDEELMGHVRNRDEGAVLALFRRYDRLALSIGSRILQDEGEAEDLAQEIFLRLGAVADRFDEAKGSARTWIIQMIYRRAFDRRAYLRRRHFYAGTDTEDRANTLNGAKSSEDQMIDRLTVQQLKRAFGELSDCQRETLEAFFFEGLSFAEIAERSGEEVKNVRHHYYRGLERLRQLARRMMRTGKIDR